MTTKLIRALALTIGLGASSFISLAVAEAHKMKMTTQIPPGIATPERLQTRLGILKLFDGVPDKATTQKTFGNWVVWRGFQVNGDTAPGGGRVIQSR